MNASRRTPPDGGTPARPFSGVYAHNPGTTPGIRIVIGTPPLGFTPLQLRGVALLIDRCCTHPFARLIATGALDIGTIDARRFGDITATLTGLDLIDDHRESYAEIACVHDTSATYRLFSSTLSVDVLVTLSALMQKHAIHNALFGGDQTVRFYFSPDTGIGDFVAGLLALGLHPYRAM